MRADEEAFITAAACRRMHACMLSFWSTHVQAILRTPSALLYCAYGLNCEFRVCVCVCLHAHSSYHTNRCSCASDNMLTHITLPRSVRTCTTGQHAARNKSSQTLDAAALGSAGPLYIGCMPASGAFRFEPTVTGGPTAKIVEPVFDSPVVACLGTQPHARSRTHIDAHTHTKTHDLTQTRMPAPADACCASTDLLSMRPLMSADSRL